METILLVEDQASVLQFAKATLESYGYRILQADCPLFRRRAPSPCNL